MPPKAMTHEQRVARFWSRVIKDPGDGCWEWTGAVTGFGYGKLWDGERLEMAYRFAYKEEIGPIPQGMYL